MIIEFNNITQTGFSPLALVTALVIMIGWFVNNWMVNQRRLREEVFESLKIVRIEIDNICSLSVDFHCSTSQDPILKVKIPLQIHKLAMLLNALSVITDQDTSVNLVNIRRSITLENFDNPGSFLQQERSSNFIQEIISNCYVLESHLYDRFYNHYHHRSFLDDLTKVKDYIVNIFKT